MSSAALRLLAYALLLAAVFAVAVALGRAIDPGESGGSPAPERTMQEEHR